MCEVRPPSNTHPQDYEAIELLGIAGFYRWIQIDSKKQMVQFFRFGIPSQPSATVPFRLRTGEGLGCIVFFHSISYKPFLTVQIAG